jgi:hypothetical protein
MPGTTDVRRDDPNWMDGTSEHFWHFNEKTLTRRRKSTGSSSPTSPSSARRIIFRGSAWFNLPRQVRGEDLDQSDRAVFQLGDLIDAFSRRCDDGKVIEEPYISWRPTARQRRRDDPGRAPGGIDQPFRWATWIMARVRALVSAKSWSEAPLVAACLRMACHRHASPANRRAFIWSWSQRTACAQIDRHMRSNTCSVGCCSR